jgi:hypothetical protein
MSRQRMIVAESLAPTPSTILAASVAPVAPADLSVFGNRIAVKNQDNTVYMIMGSMSVVCSHCVLYIG